jgi:hypothetical protein
MHDNVDPVPAAATLYHAYKNFQIGAEKVQTDICRPEPKSDRDGLPHEPHTRSAYQPLLPEQRSPEEAACEASLSVFRVLTFNCYWPYHNLIWEYFKGQC